MKTRLYIAYGEEKPHLLSDDVIYYGYWDRETIRCVVESTPELVNANLPKRTLDCITNKVVEEISAYDFSQLGKILMRKLD